MVRWGAAVAALVVVSVLLLRAGDEEEAASKPERQAELVRRCDPTSTVPHPGRASERDLRAGRMTVYAFRGNFESARPHEVPTLRGAKLLKFPLVFPGSGDLTLSVPRGTPLRLDFVEGRAPGHRVRFEACPADGGATGYPGAVLWRGPWPACATLDVSGAGRIQLPLGRSCGR